MSKLYLTAEIENKLGTIISVRKGLKEREYGDLY